VPALDTLDDLRPDPLPATTEAGVRLLDAAERLFHARGIGAVGVDLVAEAAGVTKRTLYQRFGSKSDLVAAYLRRRAHRWQVDLLDTLDPLPSGDRVFAAYDVAARWAADNPRGCAFVNAWAEIDDPTHPAAVVVQAEKRWTRDLFRRLAGDDATGDRLHLLHEGAQVAATTLSDPGAFDRARDVARVLLSRR